MLIKDILNIRIESKEIRIFKSSFSIIFTLHIFPLSFHFQFFCIPTFGAFVSFHFQSLIINHFHEREITKQ